jgi:hypothetical protein
MGLPKTNEKSNRRRFHAKIQQKAGNENKTPLNQAQ